MAEEEIGSKNKLLRVTGFYSVTSLSCCCSGLVAIGILVRAFDTAFVERETWMKVAESQKRPNRLIYPSRGNIYSSDGKLMATTCALLLSVYRFQRRLLYPSDQEVEQLGYASEK